MAFAAQCLFSVGDLHLLSPLSKNNQNNAYKEMHDAKMHDNEASNA